MLVQRRRLVFQSTCPARGTTKRPGYYPGRFTYFNPRAPRGARQLKESYNKIKRNFNPRAPRGARLARLKSRRTYPVISIHVPREGHDRFVTLGAKKYAYISIHVPREGHDVRVVKRQSKAGNFNPRAPRGARQFDYIANLMSGEISIHVPREGHDLVDSDSFAAPPRNFNPRAPRGARR